MRLFCSWIACCCPFPPPFPPAVTVYFINPLPSFSQQPFFRFLRFSVLIRSFPLYVFSFFFFSPLSQYARPSFSIGPPGENPALWFFLSLLGLYLLFLETTPPLTDLSGPLFNLLPFLVEKFFSPPSV